MRALYLYEIVTAIAGTLILAWVGYGIIFEGNIESPDYTVIKQSGSFEIRDYPPFIIASITINKPYRPALNNGFRALAGYIFGDNIDSKKMPMTAPVIHSESVTKIPMTAPVISQKNSTAHTVSFVLPKQYTLDSVPKPKNKQITLQTVSWPKMAVIKFRGWASESIINKKQQQLLSFIQREQLTVIGNFSEACRVAQYNSPWVFPLLRKNEILVPVD
ncbi:heme-binding protein [Candidatus Marinamargulisbacteria bacterium SCGC AG-410-N11]|nr:heme-binding protein [Candidatus Marinamargulisbacteria bacterium SCGC AG-410-N11]